MKISKILVVQVLFLLISVATVNAQGIFGEYDPIKIIFGPDVPQEWYQTNLFMQYLLFPFLGIWLIVWGILEELRIFRVRRSLGAILALVMALIASSTGGIVLLARGLFMIMGSWSLLVFFVVFMVGAALWGYGVMSYHAAAAGLYNRYKKEEDQLIRDIDALNVKIQEEISKGTDQSVVTAGQLRLERDKKQAKLENIREAYKAGR